MLKICLTGGPSTGKTSVKNSINKYFTELGYNVILVPEASTMFIEAGIRPFGDNALPGVEYQKLIIEQQLHMEKMAAKAAKILGEEKTIIICDRGLLDGFAYVTPKEWEETLDIEGVTTRDLLTNYDAILYMLGKKEIFTTENNQARYEGSAEEALEKGEKVLKPYLGHDNLRVIRPREKIEDKMDEVNNIIANMLGLPTRIRVQKKFLVKDLDINKIESSATKVKITQDYLRTDEDIEYRVRKVEQDNVYSYHFSILKKAKDGKREIIRDDTINELAYNNLLATKQDKSSSITKVRYSFVHNQQYFKLDVFENGLCLLEVNLTKENPDIEIPSFIKQVEDVTNDERFRNANIAKNMLNTNEISEKSVKKYNLTYDE